MDKLPAEIVLEIFSAPLSAATKTATSIKATLSLARTCRRLQNIYTLNERRILLALVENTIRTRRELMNTIVAAALSREEFIWQHENTPFPQMILTPYESDDGIITTPLTIKAVLGETGSNESEWAKIYGFSLHNLRAILKQNIIIQRDAERVYNRPWESIRTDNFPTLVYTVAVTRHYMFPCIGQKDKDKIFAFLHSWSTKNRKSPPSRCLSNAD